MILEKNEIILNLKLEIRRNNIFLIMKIEIEKHI